MIWMELEVIFADVDEFTELERGVYWVTWMIYVRRGNTSE